MWIEKLMFSWMMYYTKKGEKPNTSSYINASFTVFICVVLISMITYNILSYFYETLPQSLFEVTNNSGTNKLRAMPIALLVIIPFVPLFLILYSRIFQNINYFMSISKQTLRNYRIWYLLTCLLLWVLMFLSIIFFTKLE